MAGAKWRATRQWPPENEEPPPSDAERDIVRGDLRSNFGDPRSPWRRDRDRLYYSRAFHRLADVTQILHPEPPLATLHNRLTHSLKVAQVAGSIAERFGDPLFANPDVCEAAGLAHDVGHPPYGHIGEDILDELLCERALPGYEGNAQAFRTLTRLAVHSPIRPGLNLTRATLAATLKYPYLRLPSPVRSQKGVYPGDEHLLAFALADRGDEQGKRVEAKVVDWADDISYALHDLDDFYRASLVRLDEFLECDVDALASAVDARPGRSESVDRALWWKAHSYLGSLLRSPENAPLLRPFDEDRLQQGLLRALTSRLITDWLDTIERIGDDLVIDDDVMSQIGVIKEFVYQRVIAQRVDTARTQQRERARIRRLFEALELWVDTEPWERLPGALRYALSVGLEESDAEPAAVQARGIADFIAQMTESDAAYWERELG